METPNINVKISWFSKVRRITFCACFFVNSFLTPFLFCWALPISKVASYWVTRLYCRINYYLEKWVLGLDFVLLDADKLPPAPFILACKHQSAYETLKLHYLFKYPAVVLKQELIKIPLWGWFLSRSEPIALDRRAGKKAMDYLVSEGKKAIENNRIIIIYPQGTRTPVGEVRPYKRGIGQLYTQLNVPVVPLALNSGVFWPKGSFCPYAGKVTFQVLDPIPSGLDEDTFMKTLEVQLENASKILITMENQ